ncbi:MAG: RNA polymerase sigma factor FliA [Thiotrichales bacterium]|nr:RNA polymerase sigma factor FliA [Thiotrichales bacterium]MBT4262360.1 RNA polymerase sigma factor FliA [Thiotrichales bacterium]MBT4971441.1 RNA polymerase sigma factor FliA [Thiotrichales bacterium]MBT5291306.1 RNA polymerase sigma factor FliA [Thiotrichales bacterium]MBT5418959.1 RNA polymerase sigma factor FliA [Thiotrichales bacterium]
MKGHTAYEDEKKGAVEQQLIAHMPLVQRLANHLAARLPSSVQIDDLYQSGMIGLLEAIKKFDSSQGAKFTTYATIRIRGAMIDELRRGDWTPRSVHKKGREAMEVINRLEQEGCSTCDSAVAKELGVSIDEYAAIIRDSNSTYFYSVDLLDQESISGTTFGDSRRGPLEEIAEYGFQGALATKIKALPERERLVMALYYQEDLNLREIGEVMEVSESRVSQILGQAMLRLRGRMQDWI